MGLSLTSSVNRLLAHKPAPTPEAIRKASETLNRVLADTNTGDGTGARNIPVVTGMLSGMRMIPTSSIPTIAVTIPVEGTYAEPILIYNPDFINSCATDRDVNFAVHHEGYHLLQQHLTRKDLEGPREVANHAEDAWINRTLEKQLEGHPHLINIINAEGEAEVIGIDYQELYAEYLKLAAIANVPTIGIDQFIETEKNCLDALVAVGYGKKHRGPSCGHGQAQQGQDQGPPSPAAEDLANEVGEELGQGSPGGGEESGVKDRETYEKIAQKGQDALDKGELKPNEQATVQDAVDQMNNILQKDDLTEDDLKELDRLANQIQQIGKAGQKIIDKQTKDALDRQLDELIRRANNGDTRLRPSLERVLGKEELAKRGQGKGFGYGKADDLSGVEAEPGSAAHWGRLLRKTVGKTLTETSKARFPASRIIRAEVTRTAVNIKRDGKTRNKNILVVFDVSGSHVGMLSQMLYLMGGIKSGRDDIKTVHYGTFDTDFYFLGEVKRADQIPAPGGGTDYEVIRHFVEDIKERPKGAPNTDYDAVIVVTDAQCNPVDIKNPGKWINVIVDAWGGAPDPNFRPWTADKGMETIVTDGDIKMSQARSIQPMRGGGMGR